MSTPRPARTLSVLICGLFKVRHTVGQSRTFAKPVFIEEGREVEEGGHGEGMKIPGVPCLTSVQCKERLCRRPHVPG